MIKPTVGRIVWYRPGEFDRVSMTVCDDQPLAATVAYVWSDTCVNLSVVDQDGVSHARTSVTLHQGAGPCTASPHCEWMPFQKGQAAKTEALERAQAPSGP